MLSSEAKSRLLQLILAATLISAQQQSVESVTNEAAQSPYLSPSKNIRHPRQSSEVVELLKPAGEANNGANNSNLSAELNAPVVSELSLIEAANFGYFRHSSSISVILTLAYTIVFFVGIVGNSFVVAIVCRSPRMRTVTNYFIVNLAFADILVLLFCLPATLIGNLFIRKYQADNNQP